MSENAHAWTDNVPFGVAELRTDVRSVHEGSDAGMLQCCVRDCDQVLLPRRRGFDGQACPTHHITIGPLDGSRRTYVYEQTGFENNFIVGLEALREVTVGKRESHRLGNENSEDALSWNVFVGLLALGALADAFRIIAGTVPQSEVELYLWGHRINRDGSVSRWDRLQRVQDELELKDWLRTRAGSKPGVTEPDIILRDPGCTLVLIEAKLSSTNSPLPIHRIPEYLKRYASAPDRPDPLNREWIASAAGSNRILGQLMRSVIFASWLAENGEKPIIVNLLRNGAEQNVESRMKQHLSTGVSFCRRSWEELFQLSCLQRPPAQRLREYAQNKTVSLRKAFEIE